MSDREQYCRPDYVDEQDIDSSEYSSSQRYLQSGFLCARRIKDGTPDSTPSPTGTIVGTEYFVLT